MKKRLSIILTALLGLPALQALAAAAYPFPQNQAQPFACAYPIYNNADVTFVYNDWKADQVTAAGAGGYRRVQRNGDVTLQANSTVSEGIAYGMIIAVYMNDQALFDDLWRYHNLHLDGNGLMHWYISADGNTILGNGAASDADQDIAWALVMAHYQWANSAALAQPYLTYAQDMIGKVWTHEVEKPSMVFKPGDGWGGAGTTNVSYFDPSMYRVFAQISGNAGWYDVVNKCYDILEASLKATYGNQNNGLVPAWCDANGNLVDAYAGAPDHYQYDSCRTPFRIAKDWYYFGEPRALAYLQRINSFYVPIGAANITDGYDLNGAERPQYDTLGNGDTGQSAAFVGPALVGALAPNGNAAFAQEAYDRVKSNTLLIGGPYYDQSWTVMSLLFATGNYLNYAPTPTPSPTPDACQTRIRVNAGGPAQFGYAADKAYGAGSWGYVAGYAGAVGTSSGPISGSSVSGLYLDERYGAEIRYQFTLPNGPVSVTLQWAETYFNSANQRPMDVIIGATQVENNLDIFQAAGGKNIALTRTYGATVTGGSLLIRLVEANAGVNATIHAIDISAGSLCTPTQSPTRTPIYSATASPSRSPSPSISPTPSSSPSASPTGTAFPTPDACAYVQRINAGGTLFAGAGGLSWAADKAYSAGSYGYVSFAAGTAGTSAGPIAATTDDALFMAERYGNPLRYRFDVPNGLYQVRVRLAETYFDTAGNRNVSLVANGVSVLNSVDLFSWAGGKNIAKDFNFLVNVSSGSLYVEATSSNNNGTLCAIEVLGSNACSPTATLSLTRSPSRTPGAPTSTPTGTPSASSTRSATLGATASSSATMTLMASPSASATSMLSPSFTGTLSPTLTRSSTRSATGSPSLTPSLSSSHTPLASLSETRSPAVSMTASLTVSVTPGPSFSESPTEVSTLLPSVSPSALASFSRTPSPAASATQTSLATGTASPSVGPSPLLSDTLTPAQTPTPSAAVSLTAAASSTPQASASSTVNPSLTVSMVESLSASPSSSPSSSASSSATQSQTPAASVTVAMTASFTVTPTATPSASMLLSATPSPVSPPVNVESGDWLEAWPVPMPNPAQFQAKASGVISHWQLSIYTPGMTLVYRAQGSAAGPGWNRLDWPRLRPGAYHYVLRNLESKKRVLGNAFVLP